MSDKKLRHLLIEGKAHVQQMLIGEMQKGLNDGPLIHRGVDAAMDWADKALVFKKSPFGFLAEAATDWLLRRIVRELIIDLIDEIRSGP